MSYLDATPDLDAYFASLPLANQLLRPLMIAESVTIGGTPRNYIAAIATDGPALVDVIAQPLQDAAAPVSEWVA